MQSKGKVIGNGIFLAVVFMLTIYGVFHGEDLGAMMEAIRDVEKWKLIPGAALVFFFIWGESIILWYMMRSFGIRLKKRICFLFSSVGFFFSCITPSASGGQPMQIYYMKKEKIPIPVATVILMVPGTVSGGGASGILSGGGAERVLRDIYDRSGIPSGSGGNHSYQGNAMAGETAFSAA